MSQDKKENKDVDSEVNSGAKASSDDFIRIRKVNFTEKFRENPWIVASIVLGIVTLVLLINDFTSLGTSVTGASVVVADKDQVEAKVLDFINSQSDVPVQIASTETESGLYKITILYQGQQVPLYVTMDGKNVIQGLASFDDLLAQGAINGNTDTGTTDGEVVKDVSIDDDPMKGDKNAKVTIVEFSDFQCPFCEKFYSETLPSLLKEYVDTGKVRLVYRDFPLSSIHPYAQKAAEASECADEQGKFWEYHNKLFENQAALDVTSLKKYAADLKLNTATFNDCLDSGKMMGEVTKDAADAQAAGVSGTPGFFINGRFLGGAYPFESFKTIIDEELAKVSV